GFWVFSSAAHTASTHTVKRIVDDPPRKSLSGDAAERVADLALQFGVDFESRLFGDLHMLLRFGRAPRQETYEREIAVRLAELRVNRDRRAEFALGIPEPIQPEVRAP